MKVLIINGSAKSGKDLFVKLFKKNYQHKCYNWSTIDRVKEIAKRNFGWDGEKTDEARLLLSEIKRIWNDFNNGAFEYKVQKIDNNHLLQADEHKANVLYFTHCREADEITKFKNRYGNKCHTIFLNRKNIDVPNNRSDKNVGNYQYDFYIENDEDIETLEIKALTLMDELNHRQAN